MKRALCVGFGCFVVGLGILLGASWNAKADDSWNGYGGSYTYTPRPYYGTYYPYAYAPYPYSYAYPRYTYPYGYPTYGYYGSYPGYYAPYPGYYGGVGIYGGPFIYGRFGRRGGVGIGWW